MYADKKEGIKFSLITSDIIKYVENTKNQPKKQKQNKNPPPKLLSSRLIGKQMRCISSVQLLSRVWLFVTPWTAACQTSLSIINSQSPPKPMSIELVMPSNHLILCYPFSSCPQSFPTSGSFQMSQLFELGGQNIGVSASTSVLPMNTLDWSPLGWTGWISLNWTE